jgi:hypothetical protein
LAGGLDNLAMCEYCEEISEIECWTATMKITTTIRDGEA